MSKKRQYREIIFPDHMYEEIQLLQKELSVKEGKVWSVSSTVNRLLRFCLYENMDAQKDSFLKDYLRGKKPFLDEFITRVTISIH